MPKIVKQLSAREIQKIKGDGCYAVGGVAGLYLRILGNSRSWVLNAACGQRYNSRGVLVPRRLSIGLGSARCISLSQARSHAQYLKHQIKLGINPVEEKRKKEKTDRLNAKRLKLFADCARECINEKSAEWSNIKHAKQWMSTIKQYVNPYIGSERVSELTTDHIMLILKQNVLDKSGNAGEFWLKKNRNSYASSGAN